MIPIIQALQNIKDAVYGEEVRNSIHDAILIISRIAELKIGNGAPAAAGYEENSIYLDSATSDLYKFENGVWTVKANIRGIGIQNITKQPSSGLTDTYRILFTDNSFFDFDVKNGNGIDNIKKTGTGTTSNIDVYTITYTDSTTSTFEVVNGVGITNVFEVSHIGLVHTIQIDLSNGTNYQFTINDGSSGSGTGDMLTTVYDTDTDGIVDGAESLILKDHTGTNSDKVGDTEALVGFSLDRTDPNNSKVLWNGNPIGGTVAVDGETIKENTAAGHEGELYIPLDGKTVKYNSAKGVVESRTVILGTLNHNATQWVSGVSDAVKIIDDAVYTVAPNPAYVNSLNITGIAIDVTNHEITIDYDTIATDIDFAIMIEEVNP